MPHPKNELQGGYYLPPGHTMQDVLKRDAELEGMTIQEFVAGYRYFLFNVDEDGTEHTSVQEVKAAAYEE